MRGLQEARDEALAEDLGRLMGERWGRRLAHVVLYEKGRVHEPSFHSGAGDPEAPRRDGRRALALEVLNIIIRDYPDLHAAMMREQRAEVQDLVTRMAEGREETTSARGRSQ